MPGFRPLGSDALSSLGDSVEIQSLLDALALTGSGTAVLSGSLSDSLGLTDALLRQLTADLADSLGLTDGLTGEETVAVHEQLGLLATVSPVGYYLVQLSENLALQDAMRAVMDVLVEETLDLADTNQDTATQIAAIVDSLVLSGAVTNTLAAMALISESLALRAAVTSVVDGQIDDSVALGETLETKLSAYEELVSAAVFSDTADGMASVVVLVEDDFALATTVDPRVSLVASIQDGLDFSVGFTFDDTPYLALSMNAVTKGLSSYTNFAFESMASFNDRVYMAGDGGLYRMGGSDDAGDDIVWRVRTGMSNFGTGRQKGLDAAYLGYTATGRVALKCIVVDETGTKKAYWYELTPASGAAKPGRVLVGRGLRSVYWGFEMTNVEAGDIELDTLELHPVVFEGRLP